MAVKESPSRLVERLLASSRYAQLRGKVRTYGNRLEPDDMEGELNLGICKAMRSVKMNIGDPMEYLLSRGFRHVQSRYSEILNHSVIEECVTCGKCRPYRRNPCYTCNGKNFMIHPRYLPLLINDEGYVTNV